MLAESEVPVAERLLAVEGRASAELRRLVGKGLPALGERDVVLALPFAYADLPIGKSFDWCVTETAEERTHAVVAASTQQFSEPMELIEHGWKTITTFRFPDGVPDLVKALPEVDHWYDRRTSLWFCTDETLRARKQEA